MSFATPVGPYIQPSYQPQRAQRPPELASSPLMPAHSAKRASTASQFSATSGGRSDTSLVDDSRRASGSRKMKSEDEVNDDGDGLDGADEEQKKKRPKFSRSTRACIPCRLRKCKCAGAPPMPCTNCIEDEYPCQWPTEDGRSSKARKRQSRSKKVLAAMGADAEVEMMGIEAQEGPEPGPGPGPSPWQHQQRQQAEQQFQQHQPAQSMSGFGTMPGHGLMPDSNVSYPPAGMSELHPGLDVNLNSGLGVDWLEELGMGMGADGAMSFNTPTPGLSLQLQTQTFPSAIPQIPIHNPMDFPHQPSIHQQPVFPPITSEGPSNPFSPSIFTHQSPGPPPHMPQPVDNSAIRSTLSWPSSSVRDQQAHPPISQPQNQQNYLPPFSQEQPPLRTSEAAQPQAQVIASSENDLDPTMTAWNAAFPNLDPASFIYLMSSRLPTVEESSIKEDVSPLTGSTSFFDFSPGFGNLEDLARQAADGAQTSSSMDRDVSAAARTRSGVTQTDSAEKGRSSLQPPIRSTSQHGRSGAKDEEKGKIVKMTWWRPHGQTAIAPGLKRITLKVRISSPTSSFHTPSPYPDPFTSGPPTSTHLSTSASASSDPSNRFSSSEDLFDPSGSGAPSPTLITHLLPLFLEYFGCQFPFLASSSIASDLSSGEGSVFLWCCIAATAARFSTHPALARPDLAPHEYGLPFHLRARDLLGSMLSVPNRWTVMALVLLAHLGFGADSESEEWMCTGMAVRMSVDLGLHLDPGDEIPPEECRLNRLLFWSVFALDIAIASGVGRQTTLRLDEITQVLPTEEDIRCVPSPSKSTKEELDDPSISPAIYANSMENDRDFAKARQGLRSPFSYTVKQMTLYAPIIDLLNAPRKTLDPKWAEEIQSHLNGAIREYNQLPSDMQWNVVNLQEHGRAGQAPIFVHLHLWMHLMIASGYLTDTAYLRRHGPASSTSGLLSRPTAVASVNAPISGHITPNPAQMRAPLSGAATPNALAATNLWRNSVRTIGDILLLSDIVKPMAYLALPFVNQALYAAACCHIKEMEQQEQSRSESANAAANGTGNKSLASSPRRRPPNQRSKTEPKQTPLRSEGRHVSTDEDGVASGAGHSGAILTDRSDSGHHSPNAQSPLVNPPSPNPSSLADLPLDPTRPTTSAPPPANLKQVDLYHELFKSVALNNIAAFQAGLARQTAYWSGVAWVAEALQQRLAGVGASAIDLAEVTEKLRSCVSVPDAGVLRGLAERVGLTVRQHEKPGH